MKVKSFISLFLVLTIITSLVGCNILPWFSCDNQGQSSDDNNNENNENNEANNNNHSNKGEPVGGNPTDDPNAQYNGEFIIDTYDDLQTALGIWKENNEYGHRSRYSFDNTVGDNIRMFYYFESPAAWISIPISMEEYFSNKDVLLGIDMTTYLFYLDNGICESCKSNRHKKFSYAMTPEHEELIKMHYITIETTSSSPVEIEDTSLITLEHSYNPNREDACITYRFKYDGKSAFEISSCKELSEEQLNELFEHIILLNI